MLLDAQVIMLNSSMRVTFYRRVGQIAMDWLANIQALREYSVSALPRLRSHCIGSLVASFAKRFGTCINNLRCP